MVWTGRSIVILFVYLLQVPRDSVMERMYELQNPHIPTAIIQICCDCVPSLLSISLCSLGRGDDFHTPRSLLQKRLIFSLTVKMFLEIFSKNIFGKLAKSLVF